MDTEQRLERPMLSPREHPDENVDMRFALVEAAIQETVRIFEEVCPEGRERALAVTNLEQAGLWALCAIGRDRTSHGTGTGA